MSRWLPLVALLVGCGPRYYLVSSTLAESSGPGRSNVTTSPTYPQVVATTRKVAVRAPDRCAEQSAAAATGAASTAGVILQTRCGVEMADLERSLSRAGFTVLSWRAISDMATREKITPLAAARRMGAEVLFQVNSLEKSTAQASTQVRWERHFFQSDPSGSQGDQALLPEAEAQQLERVVAPDELSLVANTRLSVTIDVSAVWIETGETFWFYSWTNIEAGSTSKRATALAACGDGSCSRLALPQEKAKDEGARAGGVQELSLTGRPANEETAIYYKLLGDTIDDLVHQFAGTVSRSTKAAAPAPAPAPAPAAAVAPAAPPPPVPAPASPSASLPSQL